MKRRETFELPNKTKKRGKKTCEVKFPVMLSAQKVKNKECLVCTIEFAAHCRLQNVTCLNPNLCLYVGMSDDFPLRLSRHCLEFFSRRVPTKGRPRKGQEWTVFSAIVLEEERWGLFYTSP